MRTKTLVLTAVLSAAGIASSLAQAVYSINVVGYVNYPAKAPFSMIANPLNNTAGNNLNNILPSVPIGTTIFKWNETASQFTPSVFFGTWSPDVTLAPGEGAFINLTADTTLTWVGEVMQGALSNPIPVGLSIRSSQVPQALKLENSPTNTADPGLGFPAAIGDTIYFYRGGGYVPSVYFGTFSPVAIPAVGEAFWVNSGVAKTWTRNFNVNQ